MIGDALPDFLSETGWVWPVMVGTVAIAFLLHRPAAGWLGAGRRHAFLLLLSVAGMIALTLTPTIRLGDPKPYCDIASLRPIAFDQLVSISDRSLNVLLFIPTGIALGLLPRSNAKAVAIGIAVMAPLAVELTQAIATDLGRACEAVDVVDNLAGLAIGLGVAWLLTLAARRRSTRPPSGA